MSIAIKNWRDLPPGKEKYKAYLADREWAVIKRAARERSGGTCERCKHAQAEQVHHTTYERLYCERLDDLLHLCAPCHEFLSAARDDDPLLSVPVMWGGRVIKSVYLAGKITNDPWRESIVPGWCDSWKSSSPDKYFGENLFPWKQTESSVKLPDGRLLNYSGPYWQDCSGGHVGFDGTYGPHAMQQDKQAWHGLNEIPNYEHEFPDSRRSGLQYQIVNAIRYSDLVFAWINSDDCHGTLLEIGFAKGLGKLIVVAYDSKYWGNTPNRYPQTWLAGYFGTTEMLNWCETPKSAWDAFWGQP